MDVASCRRSNGLLSLEVPCSLPSLPVGLATVSSAAAAYRVLGEPRRLAFVLAAYANLVLLFWCVSALQRASPKSGTSGILSKKQVLRPAVWLLASTLNLSFAYQVAKSMAGALAAAVWTLAAVVTLAGLCAVFFFKEEDPSAGFPRRNENVGSSRLARRHRSKRGKKGKKSKENLL